MAVPFRAVVERRVVSFSVVRTFAGRNRAVCGPLPMGYVLAEITLVANHSEASDTVIGFSVSTARTADAAAFGSGQSVLDVGEKAALTGITVMRLRLQRTTGMGIRIPAWFPVKTGGMHMHTEWETLGALSQGFFGAWFEFERWEEVFIRREQANDGAE